MTIEAARQFVAEALEAFVRDPADSDFQEGYLAALYVIGEEALGMDLGPRPTPTTDRPREGPRLRLISADK